MYYLGDVVYNLYCLCEGSELVIRILTGSDGLGFQIFFRVLVEFLSK